MSSFAKALRDYEDFKLTAKIANFFMSPWKAFYYSDTIKFVRNIWRFRKELWNFRAFDFAYNVQMLCRSLEITRDFLSDDKKTMACDSAKSAKEIQHFLNLMNDHNNAHELAEKKVGYTDYDDQLWLPYDKQSDEFKEKFHEICVTSTHIEKDRWNKAWKYLGKHCLSWWD